VGDDAVNILTLCTGNAARSVMLGYMLTAVAETNGFNWAVQSAGTLVAEGSAMSARTRDALLRVPGLAERAYGAHRGRQLTREDVIWADVILTAEASHVVFVRTNHPEARIKTVLLAQFLHDAPLGEDFINQVSYVASRVPERSFDVDDPAGKDQLAYDLCAVTLWEMVQVFATLFEGS
jgi:protein-tyrosine-phosphatase